MNRGKAMKEYLVALIGKMIVQNPDVTVAEIIKIFQRNGLQSLSENYIGKLRDIALRRRIKRVRRQTRMLALAEYEGHLSEALTRAWAIAGDSAITPSIRIGALRTIAEISTLRYNAFIASDQIDDDELSSEQVRKKIVVPDEVKDQWNKNKVQNPVPLPDSQLPESKRHNPWKHQLTHFPKEAQKHYGLTEEDFKE